MFVLYYLLSIDPAAFVNICLTTATFGLVFYNVVLSPWLTTRENKRALKLNYIGPKPDGYGNLEFCFELYNGSNATWEKYGVSAEGPDTLFSSHTSPAVRSPSNPRSNIWRYTEENINEQALYANATVSCRLTFLEPKEDVKTCKFKVRGWYVHPETKKTYYNTFEIDVLKEISKKK